MHSTPSTTPSALSIDRAQFNACLALLLPPPEATSQDLPLLVIAMKAYPFTSLDHAYSMAAEATQQRKDIYFALGTSDGTVSEQGSTLRRTGNLVRYTTLYADLDCGANKAFKTQADALTHLQATVAAGLPAPTHIINSGGGLHVYWKLSQPVAAAEFQPMLKVWGVTMAHFGLRFDEKAILPTQILRVAGTSNFKKTADGFAQARAVAFITPMDALQAAYDWAALCSYMVQVLGFDRVEATKAQFVADGGADLRMKDSAGNVVAGVTRFKLEWLRAELALIPAPSDRNDWIRIGFGLSYETAWSDDGAALFHEWSSGALLGRTVDNPEYNPALAQAFWNSADRPRSTSYSWDSDGSACRRMFAQLEQEVSDARATRSSKLAAGETAGLEVINNNFAGVALPAVGSQAVAPLTREQTLAMARVAKNERDAERKAAAEAQALLNAQATQALLADDDSELTKYATEVVRVDGVKDSLRYFNLRTQQKLNAEDVELRLAQLGACKSGTKSLVSSMVETRLATQQPFLRSVAEVRQIYTKGQPQCTIEDVPDVGVVAVINNYKKSTWQQGVTEANRADAIKYIDIWRIMYRTDMRAARVMQDWEMALYKIAQGDKPQKFQWAPFLYDAAGGTGKTFRMEIMEQILNGNGARSTSLVGSPTADMLQEKYTDCVYKVDVIVLNETRASEKSNEAMLNKFKTLITGAKITHRLFGIGVLEPMDFWAVVIAMTNNRNALYIGESGRHWWQSDFGYDANNETAAEQRNARAVELGFADGFDSRGLDRDPALPPEDSVVAFLKRIKYDQGFHAAVIELAQSWKFGADFSIDNRPDYVTDFALERYAETKGENHTDVGDVISTMPKPWFYEDIISSREVITQVVLDNGSDLGAVSLGRAVSTYARDHGFTQLKQVRLDPPSAANARASRLVGTKTTLFVRMAVGVGLTLPPRKAGMGSKALSAWETKATELVAAELGNRYASLLSAPSTNVTPIRASK